MEHAAKQQALYRALCSHNTPEAMEAFLKDLCTPSELRAMSERWDVAQLLHTGTLSYRQIHAQSGASLVTIARVARFLKDESYGGYRSVLDNIL